MTIDERFQQTSLQLNLLTLKTGELDKGLNQLTANLNELTLKVDIITSQLAERHSELAKVFQTMAELVINHDSRIRRIETQPPH